MGSKKTNTKVRNKLMNKSSQKRKQSFSKNQNQQQSKKKNKKLKKGKQPQAQTQEIEAQVAQEPKLEEEDIQFFKEHGQYISFIEKAPIDHV